MFKDPSVGSLTKYELQNYPQPQYPIYTPQRTLSQYASHRASYSLYDISPYLTLTCSADYDDLDPYHADAGYATPYAPQGMRQRRYSSMSHRSRPRLDHYARRYGSTIIKFKRKGGFRSGITLGEAMSNVRLSSNDQYSYHDLGVDHRGRMLLKIRVSFTILTVSP